MLVEESVVRRRGDRSRFRLHLEDSQRMRGGCKGALVQEDVSATLSTRQNQTLFQSTSQGDPIPSIRSAAASSATAAPTRAASGTPRYKALGNSMAVPVMRWLGERICLLEEIAYPKASCQQETAVAIAPGNNQPAVCLSSDTAKASYDVELFGTLKVGGSVPIIAHGK